MAHLVRGSMLDYVEFDRDLVVAKTIVPDSIAGKRLADADVRNRFGITIVKVKTARPNGQLELDLVVEDPDLQQA